LAWFLGVNTSRDDASKGGRGEASEEGKDRKRKDKTGQIRPDATLKRLGVLKNYQRRQIYGLEEKNKKKHNRQGRNPCKNLWG